MTYREAIDWLFSTQLFGIKLGLDGPRELLKRFLAFPEHGVKVVHVAGTNGKGSTCAMIDALARAAGTRCGLFTSPHLVDFRERIRVAGVEIPEDDCARRLTELRRIAEALDPHPTFFEITLALAMRWFRERGCEMIVLETGMGGRLDATTAVPADVCAITPVGLDHTQWLGSTLAEIAAEKAGILIEGRPAVIGPQSDEAAAVIEMEANQRRAPLHWIREPLRGYPLALAGEHQAWNAAIALECAHLAGVRLDFDVVSHALSSVRWPGRFEVIERAGRTFVLDGAHNPDGAAALAETWRRRFAERRATLLFSAVASKDLAGIATTLAPLALRVVVCPVNSQRAVPVDQLADLFDGAVAACPDTAAALRALGDDELVLVAGSLFLVGEVKARLADDPWRPTEQ